MNDEPRIVERVREAATRRLLFLPHAVRQMTRPDRQITTADVRQVVTEGELIEDYPEDARGHSCLLHGLGEGQRSVHVVCAPKEDYLAIIPAYVPSPTEWESDMRTRRPR